MSKPIVHGDARRGKRTRTYRSWVSMLGRCLNPKDNWFSDYGGRGITVCDSWKDYLSFKADMGECPEKYTLGRIDNSKGYCPENCRWETQTMQARNKRNNLVLTAHGVTACFSELCVHFGINYGVAWSRHNRGWTPDRVFSVKRDTPIQESIPN